MTVTPPDNEVTFSSRLRRIPDIPYYPIKRKCDYSLPGCMLLTNASKEDRELSLFWAIGFYLL